MDNNAKYQDYFIDSKAFRDKRIEIEGPKTFSDFVEPKYLYFSKAYKSGHSGRFKTLREFTLLKPSGEKSGNKNQSAMTKDFFKQIDSYIQLRPHIGIENFEGYFIQKNTMVLSYFPNKSLAYMFKSPSFGRYWTNSLKLKLIFGVACSMMHLHANQIIHGNLSPATISFDSNWEPHLTDIARFNRRRTIEQMDLDKSGPNTNFNSLLYSSPELLNGTLQRKNIKKTDVYSFAMICYAILTDGEQTLFHEADCEDGDKPLAFYQQYSQSSTRPTIPKTIHPLLRGIIYHSWNPDPEKRPLFSQIVKALKDQDNLLGDLDDSYREYRERIFKSTDIAPQDKNLFARHHHRRRSSSKRKSKHDVPPVTPESPKASESVKPVNNPIQNLAAADVDGDAEFEHSLFNAKANQPESIFKIGQWLLYGIGCTKNEQLAIKFFEQGVKINDKPCLFLYSKCMLRGIGITRDVARAMALIKQATGIIDINNPNEDKENWFSPAIIFYAKELARSDPALADKYYQAAIALGKDIAGDIYWEYGQFLETQGKTLESLRNYLIAATHGHTKAPNDYAITLLQPADKHKPTPEEVSKAISVLQKASNQNEPTACYNLAKIYYYGKYGQAPDKLKAMNLARKSAKLKHPKGCFLYAFILMHTNKNPETIQEAKKFYQIAANDNDTVAMVQLAKLFEEEGKTEESIRYLQQASSLNDDVAMYQYALCLETGKGVPKDVAKANELFRQSASRGNKNSIAKLSAKS